MPKKEEGAEAFVSSTGNKCEGMLEKRGGAGVGWQGRYFVLQGPGQDLELEWAYMRSRSQKTNSPAAA